MLPPMTAEAKTIEIGTDRSLIYASPQIQAVIDEVNLFAPTDQSVLITGENGTGKENIARLLHMGSPRREQPFVPVNCASISASLIESELFGHEKGSFTGANGRRIGKFEQAGGGTIFLDEIGEMSPDLQAKLLRVLQDGEFCRVGGNETVTARPRIIAATNKNLEQAMKDGRFRPDLYYRLCGVELSLPDLKDRPVDIPLLAEHFVQKTAAKQSLPTPAFSPEAHEKLLGHAWPGNVRELENVMGAATIRAQANGGTITPDMLRWRAHSGPQNNGTQNNATQAPATQPTPGADHAPIAANTNEPAATPLAFQGSFGDQVNAHRERRGWTQTILARKVSDHIATKVSEADAQSWEAGKVPSQDILHSIAYLLIIKTTHRDEDKARALTAFYEAAEKARANPEPGPATRNYTLLLTNFREGAGRTQSDLALQVNALNPRLRVEPKDIHRIETGTLQRALKPTEIIGIINALDTPENPLTSADKMRLFKGIRQNERSVRDIITQDGRHSIASIAEKTGVSRQALDRLISEEPVRGVVERLAAHMEQRDGSAHDFLRAIIDRETKAASGAAVID